MSKYFFVIQTVDRSKSYSPENKIVIDIPAGVTIFEDQLGILKHVQEVAKELATKWNETYVDRPKVKNIYTLFLIKKIYLVFCVWSAKRGKQGGTFNFK